MTLSKNIANGFSPLYGSGLTNGFQPLHVFIMTPVFIAFPDEPIIPIYVSLILLIIFDTLSLYLILKIISLFSDHIFTLTALALCWMINPYIIKNTLNGLETLISFFFIVLTIYYYLKNELWKSSNYNNRSLIVLGIILGFSVLTRIDNCLLVAAVFISTFINYVTIEKNKSKYLKFSFVTISTLIIIILPWILYSFYYTGDIYPVSGRAVRFLSLSNIDHSPGLDWYLRMIQKSIINIFKNNITFVSIILFIITIIAVNKKSLSFKKLYNNLKPFNPVLIFSLLLILSYTFYIFTYWFFDRYYFPLTLIFILYAFVMIDYVLPSFKNNKTRVVFSLIILFIIIFTNTLRTGFRDLYFQRNTENSGYSKIGIWTKENFREGTIIGSTQTGAIGYFGDKLNVINLDGVVNAECFEAMQKKNLMDYIKRKKIEFIVGWENNIEFIKRESENFNDGDLILIKKIEGIKNYGLEWYVYKVNYSN